MKPVTARMRHVNDVMPTRRGFGGIICGIYSLCVKRTTSLEQNRDEALQETRGDSKTLKIANAHAPTAQPAASATADVMCFSRVTSACSAPASTAAFRIASPSITMLPAGRNHGVIVLVKGWVESESAVGTMR